MFHEHMIWTSANDLGEVVYVFYPDLKIKVVLTDLYTVG